MRRLLIFAFALAACSRPRRVEGNHPESGITDDDVKTDAIAFLCESDTERCRPGRLIGSVDDKRVQLAFGSTHDEGRTVWRSRVIPGSRLQRGDVIEGRSKDWYVVLDVFGDRVSTLQGHTFDMREIEIPTARAEALDEHDHWVMLIAGALSTLMSFLLLRGARRLQVKAQHHRWVVDHADDKPNRPPPKKRKGQRTAEPTLRDPTQLAALTCNACGASVRLIPSEETTCASCNASVAIPADYVALVKSRQEIAQKLPAQTAVFRRARILGHPFVALAILVSSYGVWKLYGVAATLMLAAGMGSTAGIVGFVITFPILFAPVAVFITGLGQLFGGVKLRAMVPSLAAVKDDKGYACRGCGAPLGSTTDGVAELCMYCGTQNLIAANLAASATKATATARELDISIQTASSAFWARFDGIWVPLLYTLGAIGIVLNPFVFYVGWIT